MTSGFIWRLIIPTPGLGPAMATGRASRPSPLNCNWAASEEGPPGAAVTMLVLMPQGTPADPSSAFHFWMIRGAAVFDGATSHAPAGSSRLTTQLGGVAGKTARPLWIVQALVRSLTSEKNTFALRRTASARAS